MVYKGCVVHSEWSGHPQNVLREIIVPWRGFVWKAVSLHKLGKRTIQNAYILESPNAYDITGFKIGLLGCTATVALLKHGLPTFIF
jgi:hypothetical protein